MAEENVPVPAPTRSDEQILPFTTWLPIGKGNLLLDLQKMQKNLIFRIAVDILQNANFFRAFTTLANVPIIYIQQFWNTLAQDAKSEALKITPVDSAHPFVSPPAGELVMDFMNELGYPEEIHFVSKMHTSRNDKPRHPVLQILWGIVTRTNVDHAELMREEFVQAIQTFFAHQANLNNPTKKTTPHIIPYCRFTKMIVYYLGSRHNIHRRSESPMHVTGDDFPLGNLKFVPKGEKDEVFGMHIPKDFITEAIQQSPYYQENIQAVSIKKTRKGKVIKIRKEKTSFQVIDEEEAKPAPEPHVEDDEYKMQRGVTRSLPVVEGKRKGIATDEQAAHSLLELHKLKKQNAETGAEKERSDNETDTEILDVAEEQGEDVSNTVALEERTVELDEGQAGSDPGKTPES
ncbi:hypothetical protein Tco_0976588 [Tanacetum coccineum]|uniref:Uncharacterized protein n=1 Tax=Tanacetum coccineum TaxID=301880 RepID=A0ABQ5EHN5_9ASTR